MSKSISHGVRNCVAAFRSLLNLREGEWEDVANLHVDDDFARFKVWAGNIGAHRTGRSSLEYRLRDASHIRKEVLRLLGELHELLDDACAIVRGERVPWDKLPDDDNDDDSDEEDQVDNDYGSDDDTLSPVPAEINANDDDGDFPSTEMEQIVRNVGDIIGCLLRLSVAIRNPAPHDRFRATLETDTSSYEPFDILHVHNKFPDMDKVLAERLGRAISLRRQYFKYREAHRMKLAEGLEGLEELERLDMEPALTEVMPSTLASSIPDAIRRDTAFDLQTAAIDEDEASVTGASQTSFATSALTEDRLSVPPLPDEARHGPFECPFCYMMISATTRRAWKKHIFRDLRPYFCLYRDCETPGQDYGRRHEWMAHVTQHHWKTWACPSDGCSETFRSAAGCEAHVISAHPGAFPPSQLLYAVQCGERLLPHDPDAQCPFCNASLASAKEHQKHVGRHQEELALFALPRTDIPEKTDDKDEDDESGTNSEVSSDSGVDDVLYERRLEKSVSRMQKKYGPGHHLTASRMGELAKWYGQMGRMEEAEKLQVQVVNILEWALGVDQPVTLKHMRYLAEILMHQDRLEEAEKLLLQVLDKTEKVSVFDHDEFRAVIRARASIYRRQGRKEEAVVMYETFGYNHRHQYGPEHIYTKNFMRDIEEFS